MSKPDWPDQIAAGALTRSTACYVDDPRYFNSLTRVSIHDRWRRKWRRITGMTHRVEHFLDLDERRAHIERLAKWLRKRVLSHIGNSTTRRHCDGLGGPARGPGGEAAGSSDVCASFPNNVSIVPDFQAFAATRNPELATRNHPVIGCTTDWIPELPQWSCLASAELSTERLCEELGLTHQRLTRLLREYCGLSANEFIDGLRLKGLKQILLGQLRVAARGLWGRPGYQAELLATGEHPVHTWSLPRKDSKFFQPQPEDWRELNAWRTDVSSRTAALLAMLAQMRAGRHEEMIENHGGDPAAFPVYSIAQRLGLRSPLRLNEACVRVFGRRLSQLERTLAQELVRYYIAAEDRRLRKIASQAAESAYIARARYLYHGDDERPPSEPYLDQWSAYEAFQKDWLDAMAKEFG